MQVTWQPFLLRPDMPAEGVPKPEGYGPNTPGSQRLIGIGKEVGIDFSYKSTRFPNTILGHCALEYALEKDPSGKLQNDLQEKLFQSYFSKGEFPNSDVVVRVDSECDLAGSEIRSYIENAENQRKVRQKAIQNSQGGVSGVPFFLINQQGMISGAQDPKVLVKAFETADSKFPLRNGQ